MSIILKALSIENYRGIGPNTQIMTGFEKLNFFVGANNSGKSIILNYISEFLDSDDPSNIEKIDINSPNRFRGEGGGPPKANVGIPVDVVIFELKNSGINWHSPGKDLFNFVEQIVQNSSSNNCVWLQETTSMSMFSPVNFEGNFVARSGSEILPDQLQRSYWQQIWQSLNPNTRGGGLDTWRNESRNAIGSYAKFQKPKSSIIPAKRQLGPKDESFDDLSGKGLIDQLAEIQSPDHHEREKRAEFDKINDFVRSVVGKHDAEIEVPHDRKHLIVHIDGKVLPLASLGTGIHEVILIAAFCTLKKDQIVCIEEPEIHLHPVLQRKLIEYIREHTSNQYFIATHSAALIDTQGASVYRVANDGYQTEISKLDLKQERRDLCSELGYKASDIVQANCILWVEGPSDRIYLKKWISEKRPDRIEGTHFSIMFYGGRLLSHLSADDGDAEFQNLDSLISLQSLNKNTVVMIDSDKEHLDDTINSTKERLVRELSDNGGLAWLTEGREIENYIPHATLQEAVKEVHGGNYLAPLKGGQFDHALYFKQDKTKSKAKKPISTYKNVNKVAVANLVCLNETDWSVLGLETKVTELIEFIDRANA